MKNVVACGICCNVCELHRALDCVCSSGIDEIAKEKVATRWGGRGVLCLVLDRAVKRGTAYCVRDCEEFPCKKYFEWHFPYGKGYLEIHLSEDLAEKRNSTLACASNNKSLA